MTSRRFAHPVVFLGLLAAHCSAAAAPVPQGLARGGAGGGGWMGIYVAEAEGGLLVAEVIPATPACLAGLRPGDLLRALDGRRVEGLEHFAAAMGRLPPGARVRVLVERGGRSLERTVVLGRRPDGERGEAERPAAGPARPAAIRA